MIGFKSTKDPHKRYSSANPYENHLEEYKKMDEEKQNETIMNPGHVDESKWEEAKKASMKEYGEHRWPLVMYLYEKMGGK